MLFRELHPAQVWGDQLEVLQTLVAAGGGVGSELPATAGLLTLGDARKAIKLVLPKGAPAELASLGGADVATRLLSVGPLQHPNVPGLTLAARTRVGELKVDWTAPGMWILGMDKGEERSPLRFMRRVLGLYDAQRSNATPGFLEHPQDGYMHFLDSWKVASAPSVYTETTSNNRAEYKVGNQWPIPPMGPVVMSGAGGSALLKDVGDFYRKLFEISAPGATPLFGEAGQSYGKKHLLCTPVGGITSAKHRLFTGRADAGMFKTYVYKELGLNVKGIRPHPNYAPRKIVLLKSSHSGGESDVELASQTIHNFEQVLESVRRVGVPYEVLESVEGMSFASTVQLFASTGILVAPHGDALAMSAFMPAHSVIVELFPFGVKRNTFRQLANYLDIHYLPLYSSKRVPPEELDKATPAFGVYSKPYWEQCESRNITGYDSAVVPQCVSANLAHPLTVNIPEFDTLMRDAVDCAACFSLVNPEWAALADAQGMPVPPPPEKEGQDKYGESCSFHHFSHAHARNGILPPTLLTPLPPPAHATHSYLTSCRNKRLITLSLP